LVNIQGPPCDKVVAGSDGVANSNGNAPVTYSDGGFLKVGTGECLPELPEGGLRIATTSQGNDLQAESRSLPVENGYGKQVDTFRINAAQMNKEETKGRIKDKDTRGQNSTTYKKENIQRKTQVLGYVPLQVVNLSLEEVELVKQTYAGVASPIKVEETLDLEGYNVNTVRRENTAKQGDFDKYLQKKLAHLEGEDRSMLEAALRRYEHLFYALKSEELGCTSQVEHSIETGDARPIKRNPYRIPYALKPVVDENIDEMLRKGVIEPSTSPWSSSIVLVQKNHGMEA